MTQALPGAANRPFAVPGDPTAVALFSGRDPALPGAGNVSVVVGPGSPHAARDAILGTVGLTPADAIFMEQVHGRGVAEVGTSDRGRGARRHTEAVPGVDALVTRATDVALAVMVADCVPVLLVDPGRAVAVVHAGRRGIEQDVVGAALAVMDLPDPGAVRALVGPAIGACCYEVPDALADEVTEAVPEADARTSWGTRSLDLPAAVGARLAALGVRPVTGPAPCTRCGPGDWFSHRRAPGEGRQLGVVCRRSRPWAPATDPAGTERDSPGRSGELGGDRPPRSVDWGP